ncbi:MAG: tellurite resistance TerB family protein [Deltaproteobacteria bacterium]|nr:tellurite resistance TerB family protein [Candidatus Anaeroferrophillacea bacterium]
MFNPERILGSLVREALRGTGGGSLSTKAGLGMGLLGVAMGAAEHFMERKNAAPGGVSGSPSAPPGIPGSPRPSVAGGPGGPPPAPPVMKAPTVPGFPPGGPPVTGPPPGPPVAGSPVVPPSALPAETPSPVRPAVHETFFPSPVQPSASEAAAVLPATATEPSGAAATLLIRAMIAAAHADGVMDKDEKSRIFAKLSGPELSQDDQSFLEHELAAPFGLEELAAAVEGSAITGLARQVYAVSILTVEIDTDAERGWLRDLAWHLGLTPAEVREIHADMRVPLV